MEQRSWIGLHRCAENVLDKYVTVLKVKLDSPIELYSGKGGL